MFLVILEVFHTHEIKECDSFEEAVKTGRKMAANQKRSYPNKIFEPKIYIATEVKEGEYPNVMKNS